MKKFWLFIAYIFISHTFGSIDSIFNALGTPNDLPSSSTLWATLNEKYEKASDEEKKIFGFKKDKHFKTIFGRLNNLMNNLNIIEEYNIPFDKQSFIEVLKSKENSLFSLVSKNENSYGVWFDNETKNTYFGYFHYLNKILFKNFFTILKTISTKNNPKWQKFTDYAQHLTSMTLPYIDDSSLKSCHQILKTFSEKETQEEQDSDQKFLEFFKILGPLYSQLLIGEKTDIPSSQARAPLFSKFKNLQDSLSENQKLEILKNLTTLNNFYEERKKTPDTLDRFFFFFDLTGLKSDLFSLSSSLNCIQTVGSPYNIETETKSTFFTLFHQLIKNCYSSKHKLKIINNLWGDPFHTEANASIFGYLSAISQQLSPSSPLSTFKKNWIGFYLNNTTLNEFSSSLFSHLFEIKNLLTSLDQLSETTLDQVLQLLGIKGDTQNTSFWGGLYQLFQNINKEFEEFNNAFGFNMNIKGSCFYFIKEIEKLLIPESFRTLLPIPLRISSLKKLWDYNQELAQEEYQNIIQECIKDDCIQRLIANDPFSLLSQLKALYLFFTNNAYLQENIGNSQKDNFDSLTLTARIQRIAENIKASDNLDFSSLYHLLFYSINSIQSSIYEIQTQIIHNPEIISFIIGSPTRLDNSLWGLINQTLRLLETLPSLNVLLSSAENHTILQNLKAVCNKPWSKAVLDQIYASIGQNYEPQQMFAKTLINFIHYFYNILDKTSFIRPYQQLSRHKELIFGENGLFSLSEELSKSTELNEVLRICGYSSDTEGKTIWGIFHILLKDLCKNISEVISININNFEKNKNNKDFLQFLSKYQKKFDFLKKFLEYTLNEFLKINTEDFFQEIFKNYNPLQNTKKNFDFLIISTLSTSPQNLYTLLQTAPCNIKVLQFLNKTMDQALYKLIIDPFVHLLIDEKNTPDSTTDSAYEKLKKIVNILTQHSDILENKQKLVGNINDEITLNNWKAPTLLGLFNEITKIISSPSFFISSLTSLFEGSLFQNFSSLWYFDIIRIFGSTYDKNQSIYERTFFSTLNSLLKSLECNDIKTQLDTINFIIGQPNNPPNNTYRSLFSLLNNICKNIIQEYAFFTLNDKQSYNNDENTLNIPLKLYKLYELLQTASYQYSTILSPLQEIGTPTPPTKLFLKLYQCLENIQNKNIPLIPQFIKILIATSKELSQKIDDFRIKISSKTYQDALIFIRDIDGLLSQLSSADPCKGCQDLANFLNSIIAKISCLTQNILVLTPQNLVELFTKNSFTNLQSSVNNLKNSIHYLLLKTQKNREKSSACIITSCQEELQNIENAFNHIHENILEYLKYFNYPSNNKTLTQFDNTKYQSLSSLIQNLNHEFQNLSFSITIPEALYFPYISQNANNWQNILADSNSIKQDIISLVNLQNCSGCVSQEILHTLLTEGIQNFILKIDTLKTFIEHTFCSQFAYQWDKIAGILQKISAYTSCSLSEQQLFYILNQPTTKKLWKNLVSSFQSLPFNLKNILENFKTEREIIDQSFFDTLENNLQLICSNFSNLYPFMNTSISSSQENFPINTTLFYNCESIIPVLEKIVEFSHNSLKYWGNLNAFFEKFSEGLFQNWFIRILEKLKDSYSSINSIIQEEIELLTSSSKPYFFKQYSDSLQENFVLQLRNIQESIGISGIYHILEASLTQLKTLCLTDFTQELENLSQQTFFFSKILTQIPTEHLFENQEFIKIFLPEWNQKTIKIAQLFENMSLIHLSSSYCPHFSLKRYLPPLISLLENENKVLNSCENLIKKIDFSDCLTFPQNTLANRAAYAFQKIKEHGELIDQWFEKLSQEKHHLSHDNFILFSNLNSLQNCYISLEKSLALLIKIPSLCLYTEVFLKNLENINHSLAQKAQTIQKILNTINSQPLCVNQIKKPIICLQKTISNIFQSLNDYAQQQFQVSLEKKVLFTCFTHLQKINITLQDLINFFKESKPGTCIVDIVPFLEDFNNSLSSISKILSPIKEIDNSNFEFKNDPLEKHLHSIEDNIFNLSQIFLAHTPDFSAQEGDITLHVVGITKLIQKSSQELTLLSKIMNTSSSNFLCFSNFKPISSFLEKLVLYIDNIVIALKNIYEKTQKRSLRQGYSEMSTTFENFTQKNGESQLEWEEKIKKQNNDILENLEKLRKEFGYDLNTPCKKPCISPLILHKSIE